MPAVDRSALVEHSARDMFALVEDVESYPRFLPWCARATVTVREPNRTVATLYLDFHGLKEHFTTENALRPGELIHMKLVSGPFRSLEGSWRFTALAENACKVEFSLRYEFSNPILEKVLGPVFHRIADSFVDAFVRRASEILGGS
ncbi:MAG: type II toxin-antitoxin system RatA family toxin [Burkholderiales bacterium]